MNNAKNITQCRDQTRVQSTILIYMYMYKCTCRAATNTALYSTSIYIQCIIYHTGKIKNINKASIENSG